MGTLLKYTADERPSRKFALDINVGQKTFRRTTFNKLTICYTSKVISRIKSIFHYRFIHLNINVAAFLSPYGTIKLRYPK